MKIPGIKRGTLCTIIADVAGVWCSDSKTVRLLNPGDPVIVLERTSSTGHWLNVISGEGIGEVELGALKVECE